MILSDKFVYIHNPKTGGTFVRSMLERIARTTPDLEISDLTDLKHAGIKKIPKTHRKKIVLTTVRHPLSHYVSRYHFAGWEQKLIAKPSKSAILQRYPNFPNLSFSEFLRLRNDWEVIVPANSKLRQILLKHEIGSETRALMGLIDRNPGNFLDRMDSLSDGEVTKHFQNVRFLKTENLNEDLYEFLLSIGLEPEQIEFIKDQERVIPSRKLPASRRVRHFLRDLGKKKDWRHYYTDEELDWICERERFFFRLFPESYGRPDKRRGTAKRSSQLG